MNELNHVTNSPVRVPVPAARTGTHTLVDCRGLMCPAPILRIAEKARTGEFESLTVLATDPDFPADIEAWCRSARATLLDLQTDSDGTLRAELWLKGEKPVASLPSPSATMASGGSPTRMNLVGSDARATIRALQARSLTAERWEAGIAASSLSKVFGWAAAVDVKVEIFERNEKSLELRFDAAPPASILPPILQSPPPPSLSALAETESAADNMPPRENQTTLLVLKNDYESLLSALMVANASAAQGMKVKVFFAFWAINMLRSRTPKAGTKRVAGFFQRMLKMMMPSGMSDQRLGKLNMGGLGKTIFLWIMKRKNILNLEELVDQAVKQNIEFVVCSMSMGMMGIDEGEIISLPNIKFAGVTSFSSEARQSCTALVF
jgi:peroxiredoxin family protein/TusA-related sulfurtransferase